MRISYNWLRQYLDFQESPEEVAELLTSVGLEVEGIERFESIKGGLQGLVVGHVVEKWQHPNADRLSCTKVDIGTGELLPIVCGAPNVAAGQKVIVASVGTQLHTFSGESFEIKAAKIRGEESRGMICAEDEIGIGESHDGILILDKETPIGKPVAELFEVESDFVFEVGLTPNRADAASHFGVARDLKTVINYRKGKELQLNRPVVSLKSSDNTLTIPVTIEIQEACPRYVGFTISNLKVKPSPQWLQNRLKAIDVRPINNVVDVTNYINHAFGQPLHAFDANKISGGKVIVKTLPQGTKFTTLDEVERTLDKDDLMICDEKGGMCIAGVFGGIESGVSEKTTSVFLESAYFNPVWIRKTAKRHALHTDASFRFERGVDPNITAYAAQVAAQMIAELGGGKISSELSDTHPQAFEPFKFTFRPGKAREIIGHDISDSEMESILSALDIRVEKVDKGHWKLGVPQNKVDVTREADIIEEILRIYGYDKIPVPTKLLSTVSDMKPSLSSMSKSAISQLLSANGFLECMSNSMIDEKVGLLSKEWSEKDIVHLSNALSAEMGIMRPAMIFSVLDNAVHNLNRQQNDLKLFEFGNIYRNADRGYMEEERMGLLVSGLQIADTWRVNDLPADWYFLKGTLELMMKRLGIKSNDLKSVESTNDWFSYGMDWMRDDRIVISAGSVSDHLKKAFGIKRDVWYLELGWNDFIALRQGEINIGELPKFPEVRRDLALLVDQPITYAQLETLAYQTERKLLKHVTLFDVYEGKGLPSGKKSYALAFSLRDEEKTLTDQEVDKVMSRLLERFKREVGAELRS